MNFICYVWNFLLGGGVEISMFVSRNLLIIFENDKMKFDILILLLIFGFRGDSF